VAVDRDGRWKADSNEPFNAALGGIDPSTVRALADPSNDGAARVVTWIFGALLTASGFVTGSIAAIVIGGCVVVAAACWSWTRRRSRRPRRPRIDAP
jgi:hypothetical protein